MTSTVKLQKSSLLFQPIFIVCVTLYNVTSISKRNVIHSFSKKKVFVLKFLFIEVIDPIYLIVVQNVRALFRHLTHKRRNTLPGNV